jgi:hypothetical protein
MRPHTESRHCPGPSDGVDLVIAFEGVLALGKNIFIAPTCDKLGSLHGLKGHL